MSFVVLAVEMFWALCVVLIQPYEGWKVETAVVADPVAAGVLFASLEGPLVSESSITASAIGHWMPMVERKRVAMGRLTWGSICMTRHGLSIARVNRISMTVFQSSASQQGID